MKKIKILFLLSLTILSIDNINPASDETTIYKTQSPLKFQEINNTSDYQANIYVYNNNSLYPTKKQEEKDNIAKDKCITIESKNKIKFDKLYLPYSEDGFMLINLIDVSDKENPTLAFSYVIFNSLGKIVIINPLGDLTRKKINKETLKTNYFKKQPLYASIEYNSNQNGSNILISSEKTRENINANLTFTFQDKTSGIYPSINSKLPQDSPNNAYISWNQHTTRNLSNDSKDFVQIKINTKKYPTLTADDPNKDKNLLMLKANESLTFNAMQIPHPSNGYMIINLINENNALERSYILYTSKNDINIIDPLSNVLKLENQPLYKQIAIRRPDKGFMFTTLKITTAKSIEIS